MRSGQVRAAIVAALAAAVVATAVAAVACSPPGPTANRSGVTGPVTVFAAASLTEAFTRIGQDFQAANPGVNVTFTFAGSPTLATRINEGAPADVFAAASPDTMKTVTDAGNASGAPVVFVQNQLVIAVANGNPKSVVGLSDLGRPDLKVALCAEPVPCGAAAKRALDAANVRVRPVTLEPDVKAALAKVALGEVDAAMVYRTDVRARASDVDGVEFPESADTVSDYPIVVVKNAPNQAGARAFVAYVLGPGREVLTNAGFQTP